MKLLLGTAFVLSIFQATELCAQETGSGAFDGVITPQDDSVLSGPAIGVLNAIAEEYGLVTVTEFTYDNKSWMKQAGALTPEVLTDEMAAQGWATEEVAQTLRAAPDVSWSVYKSSAGPGKLDFMAVPDTDDVPGFVFKSGGEIEPIPAALLSWSTVSTIQEELIENMMLALKGACDLPVRPNEIKASASAGVVGVEATWNTADVCDRLPSP